MNGKKGNQDRSEEEEMDERKNNRKPSAAVPKRVNISEEMRWVLAAERLC